MASPGDGTGGGFLRSDAHVMETMQSLNGLFSEYRECVRDHQGEKKRFRGMFDVWAEEAMRAAEKQGIDPDEEQTILLVPGGQAAKEEAVDAEDVISDVVLQHKQALLEEWESAEDIWQLQADIWVGKCTICRIRSGQHAAHDWRSCVAHTEDREAVEEAHREVERGLLSGHSVEGMIGRCGACGDLRTECWLRVRVEGIPMGCRYGGVVTESVAGILAIGPDMVREWERREGGRRGAGVSGVKGFAAQRFGGVAVCRVWRAFGWVGIWDIREIKVDEVRERYHGRMQQMRAEVRGQMKGKRRQQGRYGVHGGRIGGPGMQVEG